MEQKNDVTKKEKLPPFVGNESGCAYTYSDAIETLDEIIGILICCYAHGSEFTSPEDISGAHYFLAGMRDQYRDQLWDMKEESKKRNGSATVKYRATEPVNGDWSQVHLEKVEVE